MNEQNKKELGIASVTLKIPAAARRQVMTICDLAKKHVQHKIERSSGGFHLTLTPRWSKFSLSFHIREWNRLQRDFTFSQTVRNVKEAIERAGKGHTTTPTKESDANSQNINDTLTLAPKGTPLVCKDELEAHHKLYESFKEKRNNPERKHYNTTDPKNTGRSLELEPLTR
ncbi:MAG: hypothetical protein H6861_06990 [Rhodospirillales bacterium]|nr:hypothetical protein [Rhodospirillales bacterium]